MAKPNNGSEDMIFKLENGNNGLGKTFMDEFDPSDKASMSAQIINDHAIALFLAVNTPESGEFKDGKVYCQNPKCGREIPQGRVDTYFSWYGYPPKYCVDCA